MVRLDAFFGSPNTSPPPSRTRCSWRFTRRVWASRSISDHFNPNASPILKPTVRERTYSVSNLSPLAAAVPPWQRPEPQRRYRGLPVGQDHGSGRQRARLGARDGRAPRSVPWGYARVEELPHLPLKPRSGRARGVPPVYPLPAIVRQVDEVHRTAFESLGQGVQVVVPSGEHPARVLLRKL